MTQEINHHVFTSVEARRFRLKERLHVCSLAAGAALWPIMMIPLTRAELPSVIFFTVAVLSTLAWLWWFFKKPNAMDVDELKADQLRCFFNNLKHEKELKVFFQREIRSGKVLRRRDMDYLEKQVEQKRRQVYYNACAGVNTVENEVAQ